MTNKNTDTDKNTDKLETRSTPRFKIEDPDGTTLYQFDSLDWLLHSEVFNFRERQALRESINTNKEIQEGSLEGFRLLSVV